MDWHSSLYMCEPRILHVSAEHVLRNIITGIGWRRWQMIQLPSKTLWQCFVHYRHTVISDFPSFRQQFAGRGRRCCRRREGCCSAKYVLTDKLVSILIRSVQEYKDQIYEREQLATQVGRLDVKQKGQLTESRKKRWIHLQILTDLLIRECLIRALIIMAIGIPIFGGCSGPGWVRRCKDSGSTLQGCGHTALCHANALLLHRLQKCVLVTANSERRN
jgi:hypothetical protein